MDMYQAIYAELEAFSEPARLPEPWGDLPATPAYRGPLRDYRTVASRLRAQFSDEQLVSAGVLVRMRQVHDPEAAEPVASAPHLIFNPRICLGNWLLLRRGASEPPFDIVTSRGCLSRRQPPVLAALEDVDVMDLLEWSGDTLMATQTLADAAVLLSLEIPAVPFADVEKLSGATLEKFRRRFDIRHVHADNIEDEIEAQEVEAEKRQIDGNTRQANPQPDAAPQLAGESSPKAAEESAEGTIHAGLNTSENGYTRHALSIVDWHPAELSAALPDKRNQLRFHLANLASHLGLLMDQLFIWQPDPTLFSSLTYALANGVPRYARRLIGASQRQSTRRLIEDATTNNPLAVPPEGFERLHEDWDERSDRPQRFSRLLNEQVIGPLLSEVDAATDPTSKARALAKALYLDEQLGTFERLASSRDRRTAKGPVPGSLSKEEIEQQKILQQSVATILKITEPPRNIDNAAES